jgi:ribosome-associated translation inhibitor RaiA
MAASSTRIGLTHTTHSYDSLYHFNRVCNDTAHAIDMILDTISQQLRRSDSRTHPW